METQEVGLNVEFIPWGPDPAAIERIRCGLFEHPLVEEYLSGTRYRLLSFDMVDRRAKEAEPRPPGHYRATVYDYSNNRTVFVDGCLDEPEVVMVSEAAIQPLPSEEEFEAAVEILSRDPDLGEAIRTRQVQVYPAMPALLDVELPDGRVERTLGVGLYSREMGHRIVGVNMIQEVAVHEFGGIPNPSGSICGPASSGGCSGGANPGQLQVLIKQGSATLWTLTIVRPAASSGTNGSGIELRHVYYKGKQVLYRAHVPILNVQYGPDGASAGCGPTYRDWQNSETCFEATGNDFAAGFRLCSSPPKTILDSGSDAGNFRGVAIYVEGLEVVLISELQAGWYRYVSEWRLHANGRIRPRFGFSAVNNPCTCRSHHHHAYWRFDFDIRTAGNNRVEEFNDPPLFGSNWHKKSYEIRRLRDNSRKRKWRISNTSTGEGYDLIPGAGDGAADSYGVGDVWVLRYHGNEIDDGQGFTTDPAKSIAQLDKFLTGEKVEDKDVVVWYSGHFVHDEHAHDHIVGPELRPVNW